ncbi:MAG: 3-deoxy-7-phosphoheptulonate synthase [Candidatus Obscuribacterales bacterium]|nr:3-deoxy-7-phosphoheptulonate synthase [Candidatus Obscuribacterales bacterium]
MILILQKEASQEQVEAICCALERMKLTGEALSSGGGTVITVLEDVTEISSHVFSQLPGVEKVVRVQGEAKLATKIGLPLIELKNGVRFGAGQAPVVIGGPCSVEGQAQILHNARRVKDAGARMLRGGAYKPRSSPYEFQGLGLEALQYLAEASQQTSLPVVSEVMTPEQVELALSFVDMLQVGARNMYNYELLKELGKSSHPILLKRAFSATISEWLNAAEYIMSGGNQKVILCERGIRTFETATRNTLDLSAVAVVKKSSSLPVLVDPSHGTGRKDLVRVMSRAAIACGADGLIIEVHDCPEKAFSDGHQAITPEMLKEIVIDTQQIHALFNPVATSLQAGSDSLPAVAGRAAVC